MAYAGKAPCGAVPGAIRGRCGGKGAGTTPWGQDPGGEGAAGKGRPPRRNRSAYCCIHVELGVKRNQSHNSRRRCPLRCLSLGVIPARARAGARRRGRSERLTAGAGEVHSDRAAAAKWIPAIAGMASSAQLARRPSTPGDVSAGRPSWVVPARVTPTCMRQRVTPGATRITRRLIRPRTPACRRPRSAARGSSRCRRAGRR
jgi:hypothetical protein